MTAISIQLDVPVEWREQPSVTTDGVLLLRVLELLEAAPLHFDDNGSEESLRWQALEARVDLCLTLLGNILARDTPIPPAVEVFLSGEGATWLHATPLLPGISGTFAVYPSLRIPQALLLPAHVIQCRAVADQWQVTVRFDALATDLQDWLDKMVFRYHRRQISQLRRHDEDTDDAADS